MKIYKKKNHKKPQYYFTPEEKDGDNTGGVLKAKQRANKRDNKMRHRIVTFFLSSFTSLLSLNFFILPEIRRRSSEEIKQTFGRNFTLSFLFSLPSSPSLFLPLSPPSLSSSSLSLSPLFSPLSLSSSLPTLSQIKFLSYLFIYLIRHHQTYARTKNFLLINKWMVGHPSIQCH